MVTLRPFDDGDSLRELTVLLNHAYADLAARGLNYTASYQDEATTQARIDRGQCLVAQLGTELVGTVSVRRGSPDAGFALYRNPDWAILNQLGVLPAHRRQGIGNAMIEGAEGIANNWGCTVLALDTAIPAESLRSWYERLGFKIIATTHWEGKLYDSVIMVRPVVLSIDRN